MSVFDSVMDSVTGLFDWVGEETDSVWDFSAGDIIKAGVKGYGILEADRQATKKARLQSWDYTQRGKVGVENEYAPGNPRAIPYGLQQFAPNPSELEAFWNQTLRKFVDVKNTKVDRK